MSCRLSHLDGCYVLGALSPTEHSEFERHLLQCAECSRAVDEIAGLPALLALVPAEDADRQGGDPPRTLLPGLVRRVRRSTRRRAAAVATVAAAGGAVLTVAGLSFSHAFERGAVTAEAPGTGAAAAVSTRWQTTDDAGPVTADVTLTDVAWGTRLDLTCTWRPVGDAAALHEEVYVLVVRTREGSTEQVGTWQALPGRTMQLTAATAARVADITGVEVRENGEPVVTLAG